MNNVDLDIKVDFFKENQISINNVVTGDVVLSKTLEDIIAYMAYTGIERLTLKGKTKEDDKKYRENLKTRKFVSPQQEKEER